MYQWCVWNAYVICKHWESKKRGIGYNIVIKVNIIFLSFLLVCMCAVRMALGVFNTGCVINTHSPIGPHVTCFQWLQWCEVDLDMLWKWFAVHVEIERKHQARAPRRCNTWVLTAVKKQGGRKCAVCERTPLTTHQPRHPPNKLNQFPSW